MKLIKFTDKFKTGDKFNHWTIIKLMTDKSLCKCVCGKEKMVINQKLRDNRSRSCGCQKGEFKREKLEGKVINGITFIKLVRIERRHNKYNHHKWLCKCHCGNEFIADNNSIKTGNTKSCGCKHWECKPKGHAAFVQTYHGAKFNAKHRKLIFDLTQEQYKNLTQQNCFYCGLPPSQIRNKKCSNGPYIMNGIDRIDNNKGYVFENCVPCCKICNCQKKAMHITDFREWIKRVYLHLQNTNW